MAQNIRVGSPNSNRIDTNGFDVIVNGVIADGAGTGSGNDPVGAPPFDEPGLRPCPDIRFVRRAFGHTLDDEDLPLLPVGMAHADHGRDFDARASDGDIFDIDRTDPLAARSLRTRRAFSFSPSPAIILNASASVTPIQRNDRCEQPLSKYRNSNGGWFALSSGERE